MPKYGRSTTLEFTKDDTIFTARAGLVPINEAAKKMKVYNRIDSAFNDLRQLGKIDYRPSQLCMYFVNGILSGLPRIGTMLESAEAQFLEKLVDIPSSPASSTFFRFFDKFDDDTIQKFQSMVFDLGKSDSTPLGGYQVLVQDQSAIQKFGKKTEGVEKGYGGTLKKGSYMLQTSLIIDASNHKILFGDVKPGRTHTSSGAAQELGQVLGGLNEISPNQKRLVLGDSGYGIGDYMRTCDEHGADFVLGVKNDAWMKEELEVLDFQRFKRGEIFPEYGYREFQADRACWNQLVNQERKLIEDEWEGTRRVIVVKLPPYESGPEYLFLATSLGADVSPEEAHAIYRKDRESVEQVIDELKNQLKITELPSLKLDSNRAIAQLFLIAWNLQRSAEIVGLASTREKELSDSARHKTSQFESGSPGYRSPRKRKCEWWTLFCSYIAVGGRFTTGGNRFKVVVGNSSKFRNWHDAVVGHRWAPI